MTYNGYKDIVDIYIFHISILVVLTKKPLLSESRGQQGSRDCAGMGHADISGPSWNPRV